MRLMIAYTLLGAQSAPAGIWKGFLWVLMAGLWLLNVRPLRKAVITRPFMKAYLKLLPPMSQTEREALEAIELLELASEAQIALGLEQPLH